VVKFDLSQNMDWWAGIQPGNQVGVEHYPLIRDADLKIVMR
jgi:hypothetical protein